MRYARPPTGHLRWRAPETPETEDKTQKAKKVRHGFLEHQPWLTLAQFGPICLGVSDHADDFRDEDCLYANVWAPKNATTDMKLPVMVFIQGGGRLRPDNPPLLKTSQLTPRTRLQPACQS